MPRRGRFIAFEGGEGAGKTTQAARLAGELGALLTREPGGTPTGEALRAILLDPGLPAVHIRTETLLLLAARAQHVAEVIEPALAAGRDVVCDRFSGSTLAYQGYGRGLEIEELRRMSRWAAGGLEPDLVILLDLPAGLAAERLRQRGGRDRMEGEGVDFFDRVAEGFRVIAAAEPGRWRTVDGSGDPDAVAERVVLAARTAW